MCASFFAWVDLRPAVFFSSAYYNTNEIPWKWTICKSYLMAGHEIENEVEVCKNGESV